jgi:hypothetical protein
MQAVGDALNVAPARAEVGSSSSAMSPSIVRWAHSASAVTIRRRPPHSARGYRCAPNRCTLPEAESDPTLDVEGRLGELRPGRLFIHAWLTDTHTAGPLYCRLLRWEEADRLVVYVMLYSHLRGRVSDDDVWHMAVDAFFERHLERWYDEGYEPPPAPLRRREGLVLPLPPKKAGPSGPGSH